MGLFSLIALLFFSCEESNEIGLELDPNQDNIQTITDVIPLTASTLLLDSVQTSSTGRLLVGSVQDPVFGPTSTTSFTELRPDILNPTLDSLTEYDSIELRLRVTYAYGPIESQQLFTIHQLTQTLRSTVIVPTDQAPVFYAVDEVDFNTQVLGTATYDTFDVSFTIKLDDAFGRQLFDDIKDSDAIYPDTVSQEAFNAYFKGLAIVPDANNTSVLGFETASTESRLIVYHSEPDDTVASAINFSLNGSISQFYNISANRSGTITAPITALNTVYPPINGQVFLQSGTGMVTKVDISTYSDFLDTIPAVVLNKVYIDIGPVNDFPEGFDPPSVLTLNALDTNRINDIETDAAGLFRTLLNVGQLGSPLLGQREIVLDTDLNSYSVDITSYVRNLEDGLVTADQTEFLIYPRGMGTSVNRYALDTDNLQLRIVYTTFGSQ